MQPDYDSHSISADGIIAYSLEIGLLISVVKLGSRKIDPCSICRGDAKEVDTNTSKLINSFGGDGRPVVCFKNRTALIAEGFTEGPLVSDCRTIDIGIPKVLVVGSFNLEPVA